MARLSDTDAARAYGAGLLRGSLVQLREVREDDLPQFVRWWNEPETMVLQRSVVRPTPADTLTEQFRGWNANSSGGGAGFAVVRNSDETLIGQVSLIPQPRGHSAEFAIIIGSEHTGQGYGTETARLALRYAFDELGLHRVELWAWAYNSRALAAYRRAGFVEEGRRRDATFHNGQYEDEVIMGVLADEWRRDLERGGEN